MRLGTCGGGRVLGCETRHDGLGGFWRWWGWGLVVSAPPAVGQGRKFMEQRAALRAQRLALVTQAHDDAQARGEHARAAVEALLQRVEGGELTADFEDLAQLMAGLGRMDKGLLEDRPRRLATLTDEQAPATLPRKAQKAWAAALG